MKKLITGIAAVIILDLVFIWMVGNRNDAPDMAQEVGPAFEEFAVPPKPSRVPAAIDDREMPVDRGPVPSAPGDRLETNLVPAPAASKVRRSNASKDQIPSLDARQLFPDKVIYYGKYEAPETSDPSLEISPVKNSARTDAAAEPLAATRKRSFKSRAFGVIKMPYKWIRSFASKVGR